MYAALNQDGELIYAVHLSEPSAQDWFCPRCQGPVQWVRPTRGKPYFRHWSKAKQDAGETAWHQATKQQLADALRELGYLVQVEYPLPAGDRIADIYVQIAGGLVIECQHTPISPAQIRQRTRDYHRLGYQVIWVLSPVLDTLSLHHQWQYTLMQYRPRWGFHRITYDPSTRYLLCQYNWRVVNRGAWSYQQLSLSMDQLLHFYQLDPQHAVTITRPIRPTRQSIDQLLTGIRQSPSNQRILDQWYRYGYTLTDMPEWIFREPIKLLGVRSPSWVVLGWIWLYRQRFDVPMLSILLDLIDNEHIRLYEMPFVDTSWLLDHLSQQIDHLIPIWRTNSV